LKGFKRVHVKSDKSESVTIPFSDMAFRYFSIETGKWEVESGEYVVIIGASVKDTRLSTKIFIQGTYEEKTPRKEVVWSDKAEDWLKDGLFQPNNALRQATNCKSWLLRFASKFVYGKTQKVGKDGRVDLNMVFVYNMPFRAFARNAGHIVTTEMVDGIVTIANGHFFKGLGSVIGGFFRNRKLNKQDEQKLRGGEKQ
jgi:beta-glucosidase